MEPTKTTRSFRINNDIWELLKKEADRRSTTASALVTQAITEHISGTVKTDGGIDAVDLIKLIGGLQEKTEKLAIQLNDAKNNITKGQGSND
tara:strand:+ start:222 stop:497 length:276 start_codon:yes stop_codon:yes gene_type:complete